MIIAAIVSLTLVTPAHDQNGSVSFRSPAHAWCCSENNDCFAIKGVKETTLPAPGFRLPSGEFVPLTDALPSLDGQFWRCQHPDGARRCFFYPPGST